MTIRRVQGTVPVMSAAAGLANSPGVKRAANAARTFVRAALDIALPPLCAVCRAPVHGNGLCAGCWSKLSFITRPYCERLGIPFIYDPGPGILSMEAIANPPAYQRARAAVRFDEISRALVHALKYGDRLDLTPMMGRWLALAGRDLLAEADALVPVPLHWRRNWARRFNQSGMLAAAVSSQTGVPVAASALKRVPRAGGGQSGDRRPPARPCRRCLDLGGDGRRLCAGASPRRGGERRCAGICKGCRSSANVHIKC
jgi:predicted amidophosphoribosyltransferase